MKYSVAIPEPMNTGLKDHLIRADGQEDLCFCLYNLGTGKNRRSGNLIQFIEPIVKDRNIHGNVSFNPSYFDKVTKLALKEKKGIAFLHSHPASGWQGMSRDDIDTEELLAPRVKAVTGLPLIGLTIGNDGAWSARFWEKIGPRKYERQWCETVRVVGKTYSVTYNDKILPPEKPGIRFSRTVSSWGQKKQFDISRIKVGIVGIGSVGSQLAEALLRTGLIDISLIDFDIIQDRNLDRLHNVSPNHIGYLKSDIYASLLNSNKILKQQHIYSIPYSIAEKEGIERAIDCDIIFCCVDRPWPRFILNCISYAYLIPVIDGGIDASYSIKSQNLDQARWRTYTTGPERRCMKCMEQYTPEDVSLEQSGLLDDQKYIKGLPDDHFSNRGENVYGFSLGLAGMQMQQFLSLVLAPKGVYSGPKEMDFVTGTIDSNFPFSCDSNCEFQSLIGIGDSIKEILIQEHQLAEQMRKSAKGISGLQKESLIKSLFQKIILRKKK
jgi:molybdopterin/thiamine biosynthesis adenylyltransferase